MSSSEISAFKSRISTNIKDVRSIRADFVQTKHVRILNQPVSSSGQLYFENPGKLKWQYTKPYAYSVLFKDNKLYINDRGKKRANQPAEQQELRQIRQVAEWYNERRYLSGSGFQHRIFKGWGLFFIARFKA
ncbi:MAG: outer membrane lipoprotein carrier protein LolA [Taibaiella sp.]|nr:outer membrane lipoprotein carrier protein LolA [Taibaiella sp.]